MIDRQVELIYMFAQGLPFFFIIGESAEALALLPSQGM